MREVGRSIGNRNGWMTVQLCRRLGNRENEGRGKEEENDSEFNGKTDLLLRSRLELYHHHINA